MTRVAVLAVALAEYGLTAEGVISVFVLVLMAVGIFGALRNPPR
jgi:hypothetical protein